LTIDTDSFQAIPKLFDRSSKKLEVRGVGKSWLKRARQESGDILDRKVFWSDIFYNPQHIWKTISLIGSTLAVSGDREGLARRREAAQVKRIALSLISRHVTMNWDTGISKFQNFLAKLFTLDELRKS
jgi:hypothetical protein